jgi:hypothetical protein
MFKIPSIGYKWQIFSCPSLKSLAVPSPPAKVLHGGQAGMPAFFALARTKFAHFRSIRKI